MGGIREGPVKSVKPLARKVASPTPHRSLVERRSWATDLAHPRNFGVSPPMTDSCRTVI